MKKLISIGMFAVLCGTAVAASAQDTTPKDGTTPKAGMGAKDGMPMRDGMPMKEAMGPKDGMGMKMGTHMKSMDLNADGMISKGEFMKHHEAMFDAMKKDSNGMVSLKDMEAMHAGAMLKP